MNPQEKSQEKYKNPKVYLSEKEIAERIQVLADKINSDYAGKELTLICVLKGAFIFCADLMRRITIPVKLEFLAISSYGDDQKSSGRVRFDLDLTSPIEDRHVLIVEDILDTGLTLNYLKNLLAARNPADLKVACFLYKPANTQYDIKIDYLGFEIEDRFVVGYGLDYAGLYRNIPYVGVLNEG